MAKKQKTRKLTVRVVDKLVREKMLALRGRAEE